MRKIFGPIRGEILEMVPTIVTNDFGDKAWYVGGILHREDGPAIIHSDGKEFWYYRGWQIKNISSLREYNSYIKLKAFW